jgi:glycosyltransferase involved in cell wall biosynthesis
MTRLVSSTRRLIACFMDDLSIIIVACNEERILGKTLAAVAPLAGEIIVVDSGSTDRTLEIAKGFGARCHHQQWLGYAAQKNYAISLSSRKWILSLDADEIVTEALAREISENICTDGAYVGYRIPRLLYIGTKAFKHGGFYPDAQLRLFQNGKGSFTERKVHESVRVEGPVGQLKSPLLHYAYTDFVDYANTLNRYAQLSAQEFAEKPKTAMDSSCPVQRDLIQYWRTSKINEILHPLWTFSYRYFLRAGFLDGIDGLQANWIYKDYVRKKITYLRHSLPTD